MRKMFSLVLLTCAVPSFVVVRVCTSWGLGRSMPKRSSYWSWPLFSRQQMPLMAEMSPYVKDICVGIRCVQVHI